MWKQTTTEMRFPEKNRGIVFGAGKGKQKKGEKKEDTVSNNPLILTLLNPCVELARCHIV